MMSQSTLSDNAQSRGWWWVIGFGFFGLIYLVFFRISIPTFQRSSQVAVTGRSNTYYVIHMPAVPASDADLRERAESWLAALTAKGYQPMLLSEVHRAFANGSKLPNKTIVLVFEPGYRHSFDAISPILAKYRFPAVWIMPAEFEGKDRRYVSNHVLGDMKRSGLWDVARYDRAGVLTIESRDAQPFKIGQQHGAWHVNAGRRALNQDTPTGELNRLHLNWTWTARQVLERLSVEEIIKDKGYLTLKTIRGNNWGVIAPMTSNTSADFTLRSSLENRSAGVTWLGTKGKADAQFNLDAKGVSGELWLLARNDEDAGQYVGICFGNGTLTVAEQRHHQLIQRAAVPLAALHQPASFSARVILNGLNVSVAVNGEHVVQVNNLSVVRADNGIVKLMVYDKIVGGGRAESVKLGMTTLDKNSVGEKIQ